MLKHAVKTSLADIAANHIRQEIVLGRWELGERIPNESTLSALIKVSRGTVREAVKMLVSHGLLDTRQGSGTYDIGRGSCRENMAPYVELSVVADGIKKQCNETIKQAQ